MAPTAEPSHMAVMTATTASTVGPMSGSHWSMWQARCEHLDPTAPQGEFTNALNGGVGPSSTRWWLSHPPRGPYSRCQRLWGPQRPLGETIEVATMDMTKQGRSQSVVVGIDGSQAALDAATWAVAEAVNLGVPLRLVYVSAAKHTCRPR